MDFIYYMLTAEMFREGSGIYWSVYVISAMLILVVGFLAARFEGRVTLGYTILTVFMAFAPALNTIFIFIALAFATIAFSEWVETLPPIVLWKKDESE